MDNSPTLPCFANRRRYTTQKVLWVTGVDTFDELIKGLQSGEILLSEVIKTRGVGRKWVEGLASQFDIKAAIDLYHEFCIPSKRLDYKGPQPDYRAD